MKKVSVVVPVYNGEKFLARALDSVLSQDYAELEVVIIDDGSTDRTPDTAKRYADDPRVKYFRINNGGVARAVNEGIRRSSGEYVAILHTDDYYMPGKIKAQASMLDHNNGIGVSYTLEKYFLEGTDVETEGTYYHFDGDILFFLKRGNFIHISTTMFRRELFDSVMFDETLRCHEDWDICLKMAARGVRFGYIPEAFAKISMHQKNLSCDSAVMNSTREEVGNRARRLWRDLKSGMGFTSAGKIRNLGRYYGLRTRAFLCAFPHASRYNMPVPQEVLADMSRQRRASN